MRTVSSTYYFIQPMFRRILHRLASSSLYLKPCFSFIIHILPRLGVVGHPHIRIPPVQQLPVVMSGELAPWVAVCLEAIYTRMARNDHEPHRISTKPKLNVSPNQILLSCILKMLLVPPTRGEQDTGKLKCKENRTQPIASQISSSEIFTQLYNHFLHGLGRGLCK